MSNDKKTLADVKPGGRVRLGDGDEKPPQELPKLIVTRGDGIPLPDQAAAIKEFKRQCLRRVESEYPHLSAQPSPGGQDALATAMEVFERRRTDIPYEVYEQVKAVCAALDARQPVGELHLPPDGFYKIVFDDAEVPDESFARSGALDAALRRFEQISNKWNAHLFVRFANNTRDCTVPNATPAQAVDLAPDHRGMRVSCSGLLSQVRGGLKSNPELAEMVRQLHGHLNELGKRWYAGDRKVVDEFLQLYVIEDGARRALIDSQAVGNG